MIHSEQGIIEIQGDENELVTDLACAIRSFYESVAEDSDKKSARKLIKLAIALSLIDNRDLWEVGKGLQALFDVLE